MDKKQLILEKYINHQDRLTAAKIIDYIYQCEKSHSVKYSDFLDLSAQTIARDVYCYLGCREVAMELWGGYSQAERKIACFYPSYQSLETDDVPIDIISLKIKSQFASLSHRDFLGSILSTGIVRDKIGDIIVDDIGAKVVIISELAFYITNNLLKIAKFPVEIEGNCSSENIKIEPKITKISVTVPSLRLDVIISDGFHTSRTKICELIPKGLVKVNHKVIIKPDFNIKEADIISVQGKGRIAISTIGQPNKKGRIPIVIDKFV